MPSGPFRKCLACGEEISEFIPASDYMECRRANDWLEIMHFFMPKYSSEKMCSDAIVILEKGGYSIASRMQKDGLFIPLIPQLFDALKKLMQYEQLLGARYHESCYVCAKCVSKQRFCNSCGHEHAPTCPVCKGKLVPAKD